MGIIFYTVNRAAVLLLQFQPARKGCPADCRARDEPENKFSYRSSQADEIGI